MKAKILVAMLAGSLGSVTAQDDPAKVAAEIAALEEVQELRRALERRELTQDQFKSLVATADARLAKLVNESTEKLEIGKVALLDSVGESCFSAEAPSDLDELHASLVKKAQFLERAGRSSSEYKAMRSAQVAVASWQEMLAARAKGDLSMAISEADDVLDELDDAPIMPRSKVMKILEGLKEEQGRERAEQKEIENARSREANEKRNAEREAEQTRLEELRKPKDPQWPERLDSIEALDTLVARLDGLRKANSDSYMRSVDSNFDQDLRRVQIAQRHLSSGRPYDAFTELSKRNAATGSYSPFNPPVSLKASLNDLVAQVKVDCFSGLFADKAGTPYEKGESPHDYVERMARALSSKGDFDELINLLKMIRSTGMVATAAPSDGRFSSSSNRGTWVDEDISKISRFVEGKRQLEAADYYRAAMAFRSVLSAGGRVAPTEEAAKLLAKIRVDHPEALEEKNRRPGF